MGRPLLSGDELRGVRVDVYLTDVERSAIEMKARQVGLPLSVFLRRSGLSQKVVVLPTGAVEHWQELGRLGGLLNQVCHHLNSGRVNNVSPEMLADIKEQVRLLRIDIAGVAQ